MPQDNRMTDPRAVMREGEINQMLDPRSVVRESELSEMARENIPSNMDMGMDSMMPQRDMTDIDKVLLLIDMGLNEQDAIEAVARERSMGTVRPEEFGGQQMQAPMTPQRQGMQAPMPQQMPQDQLGALPQMPPQAPPQRPFDTSDMSREQMDMLRRGIDPFAEGMVR